MHKSTLFILVFLGSLVAVYLMRSCVIRVGLALIAWSRKQERRNPEFERGMALAVANIQQIGELLGEEARERASLLLNDRDRFVCSTSEDVLPDAYSEQLALAALSLFSRYSLITTAGGEMQIGPEVFHPAASPGFIEIGGTEDGAAFLVPFSDVIHEKAYGSQDLEPVADTIYHWILVVDLTFNDDNFMS
jgi:hypothetical protein